MGTGTQKQTRTTGVTTIALLVLRTGELKMPAAAEIGTLGVNCFIILQSY